MAEGNSTFVLTAGVTAPSQFSFVAEDWPRWAQRWERYWVASGLKKQSDEEQLNMLVYVMGEKAEDVLLSLQLSAADKKKYKKVYEEFKNHYMERVNVVYMRAKFNQRCQKEGEAVDEFISDLYRLIQYCEYGSLQDDLFRDRIVVGVYDAKLSQALQMDPGLTLEVALRKARQAEEVQRQQGLLRGTQGSTHRGVESDYEVSEVKKRTKPISGKHQRCGRCGRSPQHAFATCPARQSTCHACSKKGHWRKMCRLRKSVGTVIVQDEDDEEDIYYLGIVDTNVEPWWVTVTLNGVDIKFKIDTGVDVTVIGSLVVEDKLQGIKLTPTSKRLAGIGGTNFCAKGSFEARLQWKEKLCDETIYVTPGGREVLLGRPAIQKLGILKWVGVTSLRNGAPEKTFPALFNGLGKMEKRYEIRLEDNARPFAVTTPRRVPIQLWEKVKEELKQMEEEGVISPVDEPTEWCAPMVVVPKSDGKVRICVDYTKLNEGVRRERHMLPAVDEILARLGQAKVMSKLDACRGYFQIPLEEKSKKLTTFITPFRRYFFNRVPMGLASSGEHFQKRMSETLAGLEGVANLLDDVLVFGETREQHDERLEAVLRRLQEAGITLNYNKCKWRVNKCRFLGHVISAEEGLLPDPEKIEAIREMERPKTTEAVQRFLGMVHYHLKFLDHLADMTQPLRELLSCKGKLPWTEVHDKAFAAIKKRLTEAPALGIYDPNRKCRVSADSSSYGLGAVLEQNQNGVWKAVSFASRSLTDTEQRYAQIEKEALALTWACEKFTSYIQGSHFILRTDHKPLVPLLSTKPLSDLSARLQRFRMRLLGYQYTIEHVPGKLFYTPDMLSRAPLARRPRDEDIIMAEKDEVMVKEVIKALPMSDTRLEEVREKQERDDVLKEIKQYVRNGWPAHKEDLELPLRRYYEERGYLNEGEGLLMHGHRVVIPKELRREMLDRLHKGHLGIGKCRERARDAIWWPGISADIQNAVEKCEECLERRPQPVEPLMPTAVPERPWMMVGMDILTVRNQSFLVVVDYFSRYPEVTRLTSTTAAAVIGKIKAIFARFGIPEVVRSDNGPQFRGEMLEFAKEYGFRLITSSPLLARSNGQAESAVKIVKNILLKEKDPNLGLLVYRSTPLETGYSPAELLMGKKLRTNLPISSYSLQPSWPNLREHRGKMGIKKAKAAEKYNRRHRAQPLPELKPRDRVWVTDRKHYGKIVNRRNEPRSYDVEVDGSVVRRNRAFLVAAKSVAQSSGSRAGEFHRGEIMTRSGRVVRKPICMCER
ncbi:uncharacterized protein K02A2.6-like [Ischnura elegans]|uniref:uncharacterized protein K02A2.6-like n=1 Tax=Ischnura elegans TaxID=197161 RepID=UPI001ED8ABA9|nr:uncharacterized protein K02A2.6-like [Ischnura elegans]